MVVGPTPHVIDNDSQGQHVLQDGQAVKIFNCKLDVAGPANEKFDEPSQHTNELKSRERDLDLLTHTSLLRQLCLQPNDQDQSGEELDNDLLERRRRHYALALEVHLESA